MTKEEFNKKVMSSLKPKELVLINTNIYYNEDHIDYYMDHKMEKYEDCFKYLMEHRYLLNIKHTPKEHKKLAKKLVISVKGKKSLF